MDALITTYLDLDYLSFVTSLFAAFSVGVLLAVIAWLVSYLVFVCLRFFKM